MVIGLSATALGGIADNVTVQWNNHPSTELEHDIDTGLFLGGLATLMIVQQILIRGHRQEVTEKRMNPETN